MASKYKHLSDGKKEQVRRYKTCERKVAFADPSEAQQAGQIVYRCPYCDKWHRSGKLLSLVRNISVSSKYKNKSKPTQKLIAWVYQRINGLKTQHAELEKNGATPTARASSGGKKAAYSEILNYIDKHIH